MSNLPPKTDLDLAIAAQRGDQSAFESLVRQHYRTVSGLAFATLGDWSAAEDVAQETFVLAWKNLNRLRSPAAFGLWIRRIARNLALNCVRSESLQRRLAERYAAEQPEPAMAESALPHIESAERRRELFEALRRAPESIREPMVLVYLQEYSLRETAAALGVTENAIAKRLQRGREFLRGHLEEQWRKELSDQHTRGQRKDIVAQIAKGLAIGPAAPELAHLAAGGKIGLIVHQVQHAGASGLVKTIVLEGVLMSSKQLAAGIAVVVIGAAALWFGMGATERGATPPGGTSDAVVVADADTDGRDGTETGPSAVSDGAVEADNPASGDVPEEDTPLATAAGAATVRPKRAAVAADEPKKPAAIEGIVIDQELRPVAGAAVNMVSMSLPNPGRDIPSSVDRVNDISTHRSSTTDAAGVFRIGKIEFEGEVMLSATGPGLSGSTHASLAQGETTSGVEIKVTTGVSLLGKVIDPKRQPVAGAVVMGMGFVSQGVGMGGFVQYTATDERGEFELVYDAEGLAGLNVIAPGFWEQSFNAIPVGAGEIVELQLTPPAKLEGTVSYRGGDPAPDIRVRLSSENRLRSEDSAVSWNGAAFTARTDDEGHYVFDALPVDTEFSAQLQSVAGITVGDGRKVGPFRPGASTRADFTLDELIAVRGVVLGRPSGLPVPGASVVCIRDGKEAAGGSVEVDGSGRFEMFIAAEPGPFQLVPCYDNTHFSTMLDWTDEIALDIELVRGRIEEVSLSLGDPMTIPLRVTNARGEPIPDLAVQISHRPTPNSTMGYSAATRTDADGRWVGEGFAPYGEYQLGFEGNDTYSGRETAVYAGAPGEVFPEQTYVLYGKATVQGTFIVEAGTTSVGSVRFGCMVSVDGEPVNDLRFTTTSEGFFEMKDVPAATVTFEFRSERPIDALGGQGRWQSIPIALTEGSVVDLGAIALERGESEPEGVVEQEEEEERVVVER